MEIKKNKRLLIGGAVVLTVCLLAVFVYAKYLEQQKNDVPIKAAETFFTSDVLLAGQRTKENYIISEWQEGDTATLSFELRNYPDSQRFSNREISYKLRANDGSDDASVIFSPQTGDLGKIKASTTADNQQSQRIDVALTKDFWTAGETEKILKIAAETTAPYQISLSGTFLIKKRAMGYQLIVDDAPENHYVKVTIEAITAQSLQLVWDSQYLVPDQTNPCFEDITNIKKSGTPDATIRLRDIPAGGSVTFKLLKFDESEDYSEPQNVFSVKEKESK